MNYHAYILISTKDKRTYVGFSTDVKMRFLQHNLGKVNATKHRRPLKLIYVERCANIEEAKMREKYWKSGGGRRKLKEYFLLGFPPIKI